MQLRAVKGLPSLSKRQWGSIGLRIVGVGASLLTNIVIAKRLALAEIAYYYLYATLAYFGNAGLYVGCSVFLQRHCSSLAKSHEMDRSFFVRYIAATLIGGTLLVGLFSFGYLVVRGDARSVWPTALWCAVLSGATYLSAVGRDLLALSHKIGLAAFFGFTDQILRLGLVMSIFSQMRAGALEVTSATALAYLLSSAGAITTLIFICSTDLRVKTKQFEMKNLARTIAPVGSSGLLNWLQLQSYRPVLLYFGIQPEAIGIASLLTALGTTGANPIFTVATQSFIPNFYAGDPTAFRRSISLVLRLTLVLGLASIPGAIVFLLLSNRQGLLFFALLVPLGVMVEAANNMIGACIHRQNSTGGSMWILAVSSCVGVLTMGASWFLPILQNALPYKIGCGMVASQLAVLGTISLAIRRRTR